MKNAEYMRTFSYYQQGAVRVLYNTPTNQEIAYVMKQ